MKAQSEMGSRYAFEPPISEWTISELIREIDRCADRIIAAQRKVRHPPQVTHCKSCDIPLGFTDAYNGQCSECYELQREDMAEDAYLAAMAESEDLDI